MIIVRFQGGLGNQMFQYAYFKELEFLYPDIKMLADLSDYYGNNAYREWELKKVFGIELNTAQNKTVMKLTGRYPGKPRITFISKKLESFFNRDHARVYPQHLNLRMMPASRLDEAKDWYIEGFWISENCFYDVREEVARTFRKPISEFYSTDVLSVDRPTVSVHIRRGDYIKDENLSFLSDNYYKRAIKKMIERVENPIFIFFSDEPQYVVDHFGWLDNKKIVSGNEGENAYRDMFLMALCDHNIIANSTFSYWGAYLNDNPEKIVIAPDKYLLNEPDILLIEEGWLKMKV